MMIAHIFMAFSEKLNFKEKMSRIVFGTLLERFVPNEKTYLD